MILLTREDLEALSKDERDLAMALGLDIDSNKATRKSHARCTSGEDYILITNVRCRLCNSTHTKIFKMAKNGNHLFSEEIDEVPPKEVLKDMSVRSSSYIVRLCWACQSYLMTLTKEELIQKFLAYIRDSRNFVT
ncbi:MAG: hypothetical protein IMF19_16775 [Proteobacteria bacterium]|nr:hypothetical protein [Pseudomonadota bacterium]